MLPSFIQRRWYIHIKKEENFPRVLFIFKLGGYNGDTVDRYSCRSLIGCWAEN